MILAALIFIPLALAILCAVSPWLILIDISLAAGYAACLACAALLARARLAGLDASEFGGGLFQYDALSLLLLLLIAATGLAGALYSPSFVRGEIRRHGLKPFKFRKYFILYNLLFSAMTTLALCDNIGLMWIMIEATTLISALLVSFDNKKAAVQAAWRYLLICSIGIVFALLGTILAYYASLQAFDGAGSMSWKALAGAAKALDPHSMRLAFVFLILGYGTKAGLVPMARWKPRTYGEAPSCASAIMSGPLVACAVYALARFAILSAGALGSTTVGYYFILLGALSVAFSTPMIVAEHDIKRLFAYSSIEHVGLIAIGFGFWSFFGVYGALFHLLNNALAKVAMYFTAGNAIVASNEHDLRKLSGLAQAMPLTAITMLACIVATTGTPPFALFSSELAILKGGILTGHYWTIGLALLSLFVAFAALYAKFLRFSLGPCKIKKAKIPLIQELVPLALLGTILIFGFLLPPPLHRLIVEAASLFGVSP